MKRRVFCGFVFIMTFFPVLTFAQDIPVITPPSPTAYELRKYGQIPVGLFTGTPMVDVPIYHYQAGKLTVPISMSYNSNGIKVDQISSNVGLGWSLNSGGVITRIIKDEPDEDRDVFYPYSEIYQQDGYSSPMALDFFYNSSQPQIDTETDMYMFNFLGNTGSFVFDSDKSIVMIPNKDILITTYLENDLQGFKAITSNGIEYIFLDTEITRNKSAGGGHVPSDFHITSWYLTKIRHPNGDQINFIYVPMGYSYNLSKTQSMTVPTPLYQNGCPNGSGTGPGYTLSPEITNILTVSGKRLVEINSNNDLNGKLLIHSAISHPEIPAYMLVSNIELKNSSNNSEETFNFDYLITPNKRVFLKRILFKDQDENYNFEYYDPNELVSRLSKAQDNWGYYNGNGILKKLYCFGQ